ncbi:MAG: hypothetical protein AB7J35_01625 [Dehalococcoidia bacterium]
MPRSRTGLGQGLEALVPPLRDASSIATLPRSTAPETWEVATLRRKRKGRCVLTVAPPALLKKTKKRKIKASTLLTLGALGASGWELIALSGKTFYLKRPVMPLDSQ